MSAIVAPFFRASVVMDAAARRLCARDLPAAELEAGLRQAPEILRQNLRRLFAAVLLADALGAPLVSVEGWRSNEIARRQGGPHDRRSRRRSRFVTGSWWFALWWRVLRRRGLVGAAVFLRRDVSRCTWEEARGLIAVAGSFSEPHRIIGISDMPCPSAVRAARYLRTRDEVMTPSVALVRAAPLLTPVQLAFWNAIKPRARETHLAAIVEAPNWVVHGLSEIGRVVVSDPPLEARLARALRADRRS